MWLIVPRNSSGPKIEMEITHVDIPISNYLEYDCQLEFGAVFATEDWLAEERNHADVLFGSSGQTAHAIDMY